MSAPRTADYSFKANGSTRYLTLHSKFGALTTTTTTTTVGKTETWKVSNEDENHITFQNAEYRTFVKTNGVEASNVLGILGVDAATIWECENAAANSYRFKVNYSKSSQYLTMDSDGGITLAPRAASNQQTQLWDLMVV